MSFIERTNGHNDELGDNSPVMLEMEEHKETEKERVVFFGRDIVPPIEFLFVMNFDWLLPPPKNV